MSSSTTVSRNMINPHDMKYPTDKKHRKDIFKYAKYFDRVWNTEHKRLTNTIKATCAFSLIPLEIANNVILNLANVTIAFT
jgi:hypothetical protein